MNRIIAIALFLTIFASMAMGQVIPAIGTMPTRFNIEAGYDFVRANAPPGLCNCFNMNGVSVSFDTNLSPWLALTGTFARGRATQISTLGQNLNLTSYEAGPKINFNRGRYIPFVEFEAGVAHGSDSYFPSGTSASTSATSFEYSPGAGIDIPFSSRISIRPIAAQYVHTSFPNGTNNSQKHLQFEAGVVMSFDTFGHRFGHAVVDNAPASSTPDVQLSCNASTADVVAGNLIEIVSQSITMPRRSHLTYSWSTSGGSIQGDGDSVFVRTENLAPGTYDVEGRAAFESNPDVSATCQTTFRVVARSVARTEEPVRAALPSTNLDADFRQNVGDIFFDYDQSAIRTDDTSVIDRDAAYMANHPAVTVMIAGYADERGSTEYNIALGLQRATVTRDALAAAGVAPDRMRIVSYGKEKPFCVDGTEACFQENRRAQVLLDRQ